MERDAYECVTLFYLLNSYKNTRGTNDDEVSRELIDFLHYLENTTSERAKETKNPRIQRIHDRVCKVKKNEEVGVRYMQAWEEKYYAKIFSI